MNYVISKDIIFLSTPFSREAFYRLERFSVPGFKIGSGECNNFLFWNWLQKLKSQ